MLTAEDRGVAENWLRDRKIAAECPSCGGRNRFYPGVYAMLAMCGPALSPDQAGNAMPVVAVMCADCCHVRFFSAGAMALPSVSALLPAFPKR